MINGIKTGYFFIFEAQRNLMPRPFKKIKNYFNFNRTEQRGLIILLLLLILIVAFNLVLPTLFTSKPFDYSVFEAEIAKFEQEQQAIKDSLMQLTRNYEVKKERDNADHIKPFRFDPNGLPRQQWKKLGFSDEQIDVIKNYESRGGRFREVKDLAKVYSISQAEFNKLEPYIDIAEVPEKTVEKPMLTPVPFDPNTATRDDFIAMGLDERLADNIINYRNKGGHFNDAEDFGKLYTLTEEEFKTLKPFIQIDHQVLPDRDPFDEPRVVIELNSADSLDLQQLPGIGPAFASRIVKYRDLLGGYHHKEQLLEVYGMDSARYAAVAQSITVDPVYIHKININAASVKELIGHPYIEFYLAKSIITYRENIGSYSNIDELLNAKLIYRELFYKIAPYLTLHDKET